MSWDAYISDSLMAPLDSEGNTLLSAAIVGIEGQVWAQSEKFPQFTDDEFKNLMAAITDTSITSVFLAEVKYLKLYADETTLRCRKDKVGFIARKCTTAIVIGFYSDPPVPAPTCSKTVEALGEYLENQGY